MSLTYSDHPAFCINLKRRPDRRSEAEAEFAKYQIPVMFIDGVDGKELNFPVTVSRDSQVVSKGDYGCTLSHLSVVKLAKEKKLPYYWVFEDDIEFHPDLQQLLIPFLHQVPENWDMVYLGGNHDGGIDKVTENVYRMRHSFATHAMIIKETIYDALIEVWGGGPEKVDVGVASLHSKFNCYVLRPHLAFQRNSFSDILERFTIYDHLRK